MRLEAVTVCVGYDDFLSAAALYNIRIFDRWVVVTEPEDEQTREVCRRHNIECLLSEDGSWGGADFAKGRLIERGLQHLSSDAWRLHLDADIVLPAHTWSALEVAELQKDCIYGIDRLMVNSWDEWQKVVQSGYLDGKQFQFHCNVNFPPGLRVGSRWAGNETGYVPIGFFQLWHSSQDLWRGVRARPYPCRHNTACRTDVQHALQWDRRKRVMIPEIIAVHLASEDAKLGANWKGRTTMRFGPGFKAAAQGCDSY